MSRILSFVRRCRSDRVIVMAIVGNLTILRADKEIRSFPRRLEREERDGCGLWWVGCVVVFRIDYWREFPYSS